MKELLIKLNACEGAVEWAGDKTWEEIYKTCHRGDWLLWLFKKTNPEDLQRLTLTKGYYAKTVIDLMKDERSIKAVKAAIKFGEGKSTKDELDAAALFAFYAIYAAISADSANYPGSAIYAADSASSAANTDSVRTATYTAAAAASFGAASAVSFGAVSSSAADCAAYAKKENQQLTADICRKYLPIEIWNINQLN